MSNIKDTILREVQAWESVTIAPHRFGGTEFQVNGREIGHLHGDYQADIPFTAKIRKELIESGKASPHHIYPNSGWISYYIHGAEDIPLLLELLRMNYERLAKRRLEINSEELAASGKSI
ncbi:luciferase domain-containing protein [Fischerella sp. PCC 9605]|uniref:luciferase domain-containing protein n=1 Tax=Fischerella sp. PCC 9605 TaxID=1173024 RepID=UPI00047C559F|nr:luciferase family protein [Fischerella sp. PCC 9605]